MSLSDHSIQRSMNVAVAARSSRLVGRRQVSGRHPLRQLPGANSPNNALTVVDLTTNSRQTFGMGAPPLGVAFGIDNAHSLSLQPSSSCSIPYPGACRCSIR